MTLGLAWLINGKRSRLRAGRVFLAVPSRGNFAAWSALRAESRAHLIPYEPMWSNDELSWPAFRRRLRRYAFDRRQATGYAFFVFRAADDVLLGGVTLSNVRRGVTQTATVGYWIGKPFVRQGYASEALSAVLLHAYEDLGLNRVEAACMPSNRASIGVLEQAGFRREGLARRYLRINGAFEDHLLFGRLRGDDEKPIRSVPNGGGDYTRDRDQMAATIHAEGHGRDLPGAGAVAAEGPAT